MLPIFGGTLPGLVLHSTCSFFFFVFLISFSHHDRPFQLASWQNCINTEARNLYFRALHGRLSCCTDGSALKEKYQQTQQTLLSPIPNQHTLCRPIIPSPPTTANLLICPISPLQSNCSPSLEIAYHRPSLSPTTPYRQNSRPRPIYSARLGRHVLALIHTYAVLRHGAPP